MMEPTTGALYKNSYLLYTLSRVQMASVGELQILPSRVQFPLDSTISYQLIIVNTARSAFYFY